MRTFALPSRMFAACVALVCGALAPSTSLAQLIDDFSGDLSAYTSTVILDNNAGASNTAAWQISSQALQLSTTVFDGIEQYAFIRDGLSLDVGEELQMDLVHNGSSQDLGLYVGGTTPVTGTRQDYIAVYARDNGQVFSRGFDGTTEYGLVGGATPAYESLFIARTGSNTYDAGYYEGGIRNIVVTRNPTTPNDADVVGFYADVRAVGDLGSIDNLRVIAPVAGDVDGDGDVDYIELDNDMISDYDIIKDNLFSAGGREMGNLVDEGNTGFVDFADFRAWKTAYEATLGGASGVTIPEPTSATLLLLASAAAGLGVRRRS